MESLSSNKKERDGTSKLQQQGKGWNLCVATTRKEMEPLSSNNKERDGTSE